MNVVKVECIVDYSEFFTQGSEYKGYLEGDVLITTDDDNSKNALFKGEYKILENEQ